MNFQGLDDLLPFSLTRSRDLQIESNLRRKHIDLIKIQVHRFRGNPVEALLDEN